MGLFFIQTTVAGFHMQRQPVSQLYIVWKGPGIYRSRKSTLMAVLGYQLDYLKLIKTQVAVYTVREFFLN